MNSSSVFLVLSCIIAVVLADCPNCGPPQDPAVPCGEPDCSIPENRQNHALFPHPDPNFFWQCYPSHHNVWIPIARPCACETVFNPNLSPRRCSRHSEEGWHPICQWISPPIYADCPVWCPDCGDQATPPTTTTTPLPGEPATPAPPGPPNGDPTPAPPGPPEDCPACPPTCPPCIWWPCWPCNPCWCSDVTMNNSRNPMSRSNLF